MRGPVSLTPEVLADHCTVTARVNVRLGRDFVATDVPLLSGTFESSLRRGVQDKIVMRFERKWLPKNPWDALEVSGQLSQVFVDVARPGRVTETVNLGWYRHAAGRPVGGDEVEVTAYGLLFLLEEDPFPWPSSPKVGVSFREELARLAHPHLGVRAVDPLGGSVVPGGLAWGTDRLKAVHDFAVGRGGFVRVENDGVLWAYQESWNSRPVVEYSTGDLLVGVPEFEWSRRPNVFTATGERERSVKGSDGKSKTVTDRWDATVQASGVRDPRLYGTVREVIPVQQATGAVSVAAAANTALRDSVIVVGERSFEMVPDPRLQVGDVASFVEVDWESGFSDVTTGRVVGLSFPLVSVSSQVMRCDVEVLAW